MTKALDRVERLDPGRGKLDLGLHLNRTGLRAGLDYEHRLKKNLSAFATAGVEKTWGNSKVNPNATLGLRFRF